MKNRIVLVLIDDYIKKRAKWQIELVLEISMPEYNRQWDFGARHWSRSFLITCIDFFSMIDSLKSELFIIHIFEDIIKNAII